MYPQNPELLQGIYRAAFFDNVISGDSARFYSKLSKITQQTTDTVTYTSFGSVPEPVQLSGTAATAGAAPVKTLKDYKMAVTVHPYTVKIGMPRSVAEDNPQDAQGMVAKMGQKASFYYDRAFIACLASSTLLGYDGKVVYSTTHAESGSNQDNARTATGAGTITAAEMETGITAAVAGLQGFTDDQGTYVNEGVNHFTILCNPLQWGMINNLVNPNLNSVHAADVTGGTGKFRGMFTVIPSMLVTTKVHHIFADGGDPAVGYFTHTDWDLKSNMYTASDLWNDSHEARFTGYARFAFYPWQWKSCIRTTYS
jgi:hypothetical protein